MEELFHEVDEQGIVVLVLTHEDGMSRLRCKQVSKLCKLEKDILATLLAHETDNADDRRVKLVTITNFLAYVGDPEDADEEKCSIDDMQALGITADDDALAAAHTSPRWLSSNEYCHLRQIVCKAQALKCPMDLRLLTEWC